MYHISLHHSILSFCLIVVCVQVCVPHWACVECVITHPLWLHPTATHNQYHAGKLLHKNCLCSLYVCVSPHLRLVTMEIGQAAGTWGKSRTMWFSKDRHSAALVEKHTETHTGLASYDVTKFLEARVETQVNQTPWPCAGRHKETRTCGCIPDSSHTWKIFSTCEVELRTPLVETLCLSVCVCRLEGW